MYEAKPLSTLTLSYRTARSMCLVDAVGCFTSTQRIARSLCLWLREAARIYCRPSTHRPPPGLYWEIVDEIDDGACLQRTIYRHSCNNLVNHFFPSILSHKITSIFVPGTGHSKRFGKRNIHTTGLQPTRLYHSCQDYFDIMSHPHAYVGDIVAAAQLYSVRVVQLGN